MASLVISEKTIRSTIKKAKKAFETRYPKVQFAWSYKTNYLNAVCSIFHQEGSWAEVVSGFEYDKAINLGVDGRKIIFNFFLVFLPGLRYFLLRSGQPYGAGVGLLLFRLQIKENNLIQQNDS